MKYSRNLFLVLTFVFNFALLGTIAYLCVNVSLWGLVLIIAIKGIEFDVTGEEDGGEEIENTNK